MSAPLRTWTMRYDETLNHSAIWKAEDFAEPTSPQLGEDDPWAMPSADDTMASDSFVGSPTAAGEEAVPTRVKPPEPDWVDAFEIDDSELTDWDADQPDEVGPHDRASSAEWAVLLEWDSAQPTGAGDVSRDAIDDVASDGSFLDEPLPWANYDSELGQSLYEPNEDLAGLPRAIKVDEWVASIGETNDAQREELTDLLRGFSASFLRSWLPWLRGQQWTGRSVLLFLQFRAHWDETPEFWEASFWDSRISCWRPTWNRYNLSREDQFELVQLRNDRSPAEIIDGTWFDDWQTFALWSQGYEKFADFALFRAALAEREDWQSYVPWYHPSDFAESDTPAEDFCSTDLITAQLHHKFRQKYWFAEQDWHDPVEWHGGLGW